MADIDNLQIQISADAKDAAESISSLAGALDDLANKSSGLTSSGLGGLNGVAKTLNDLKKGLKIPDSFSATTDQIKTLFGSLSEIEAPNIDGIVDTFSKLGDALYNAANFSVEADFTSGVNRIAEAASTLNGVDFTGFDNMSNALRNIPDNMRVTFGATSAEVDQLTDSIVNVQDALERLANSQSGNTSSHAEVFERSASAAREYNGVLTETERNIIRQANAWRESQREIERALSAYETMGQEVTPELQRLAEEYGVLGSSISENSGILDDNTRRVIEQANEWRSNQREIRNALNAYETLGETVPPELEAIAQQYRLLEQSSPFGTMQERLQSFNENVTQAWHNRALEAIRERMQGFGDALEQLTGGALKGFGAGIKAILSPVTAVGKAFTTAAGKAADFLKSIKRIVMYRAIRTMIKAITDGFSEGRKNLYYYSQAVGTDFAVSMDNAATAALYLKNSIGAATAPLTNALVPALEMVIDKVVDVINVFNEMTAVLTHAPTWTKAVKYPTTWQDAADDATASAKKLKSTMLGFDELNVIEPNTPSSKNNMKEMLDYSRMFQEMQTNFKFPDKLDPILQPIRLAWDEESERTLDTLKKSWESILGLVGAVGRSFAEVWNNGTGKETVETILFIVQGIMRTIGNIAERFRQAWEDAGTGTQIVQNVWDTVNNLLGLFGELWADAGDWAAKLNFKPLLEGVKSFTGAIKELTAPTSGFMKILRSLWRDVVLPVGKWLIESGVPAVLKLGTAVIKLAKQVGDNLSPAWDWLYKNILKPAAGFIGDILIGTLEKLTDMIDGLAQLASGDFSIADKVKEGFMDLSNPLNLMNPLSVGENLGAGLADGIRQGISGKWKSLKEWFKGLFTGNNEQENPWDTGNVVLGAAGISALGGSSGMNDGVKESGLFDAISESWNGYIEDWGTGFETLKQDWQEGWNSIKQWALDGLQGVKDDWNGYKDDWAVGFETMRKTASQKWASIKTNLQSGWDTLKNKVSTFASDWSDYFGQIGEKAYDKWNSIKDKWSNNWGTIKQKVSEFRDDAVSKFSDVKEKASQKWDGLKQSISDGWDKIVGFFRDGIENAKNAIFESEAWKKITGIATEIKDAIFESEAYKKITGFIDEIAGDWKIGFDSLIEDAKGFAKDIINAIKGIWDDGKGGGLKNWKISELIAGLFDGIADLIGWNNIKNKFLENIESIVNFFGEGINSLLDKMPDFIKDQKGILPNFRVPTIKLGRYAEGGFPNYGDVFIANESGAEMVGRIGSKTAVANNEQITEAISRAVYSAFTSAIRSNANGGEKIEVVLNIDGREVTRTVEETQQRRGQSLFSGGVYV